MSRVFFLGVRSPSHLGHYFYSSDSSQARYTEQEAMPFRVNYFDGLVRHNKQSEATLVHLCGWTVLTMADMSGDKRWGSSATFFIEIPNLRFHDALDYAIKSFPEIVKRICAAEPITQRLQWNDPNRMRSGSVLHT